ncbi:MAG: peroxide stress protein YaaA [Flavobacteriales bacterium]
MICIVSPAKNLNEEPFTQEVGWTKPKFLKQAESIANILKEKSPQDIGKLMHLSEKLSNLNYDRNQAWKKSHTINNAKPAMFCFNGDTYQGLDANSLSSEEIENAQNHLRILSGLYGLLKPLDVMRPYRLEMGTTLANDEGSNLYHFWKGSIGKQLQKDLKASKSKILLNCASNEYFKAVDTSVIKEEIWTPVFKDFKTDKYKIISFFAKKARGMMARFVIQNHCKTIEDLYAFNSEGYYFKEIDLATKQIIFYRD